MTTNKPEVVAWSWVYRGRHMATTDYSQALELAEPPYPTEVEPLIRLADYQRLQADHERLQAECDKLRKVADQYRRLIELGEDFQWENIIRVDISNFPSRADAIDAVMQWS